MVPSTLLESVSTIVKLWEFLITFEHLFNIAPHNADHFLDLGRKCNSKFNEVKLEISYYPNLKSKLTKYKANLGLGLLKVRRTLLISSTVTHTSKNVEYISPSLFEK